jgi:hypothetical protein
MKKVIILTVVLVFALVSVSWAVLPSTGPRITYGGYVQKNIDGTVSADTLICVFNPNNFVINTVGIAVFDKDGVKIADTALFDHGSIINNLPAKAWAWQTIGNLIPTPLQAGPATKYTFVVYWALPTQTPDRGLVIEVKEMLFLGPVPPGESAWMSTLIKTWSEAAIGKGDAKGVGYAKQ